MSTVWCCASGKWRLKTKKKPSHVYLGESHDVVTLLVMRFTFHRTHRWHPGHAGVMPGNLRCGISSQLHKSDTTQACEPACQQAGLKTQPWPVLVGVFAHQLISQMTTLTLTKLRSWKKEAVSQNSMSNQTMRPCKVVCGLTSLFALSHLGHQTKSPWTSSPAQVNMPRSDKQQIALTQKMKLKKKSRNLTHFIPPSTAMAAVDAFPETR